MELDLGRIERREVFTFQGRFSVVTRGGGAAEFDLTVKADVTCTGNRFYLDAGVEGELAAECDRCLTPATIPVTASFNMVFQCGGNVSLPGDMEEDFILLADTEEEKYDIFPRVKEAAILELPIKFLCSAECRGLCTSCGKNLNEGDCECEGGGSDPRWESLKNLLNRKEDS